MNRGNAAYKKLKREWLAAREKHGGWYECEKCGKWTQEPELDHIKRTGMGGSPERLLDTENWQLLCGGPTGCHIKKDGGFVVR